MQHVLFAVTASNFKNGWRLTSADVKSAFLKGDPYVDGGEGSRELFIQNVRHRGDEPSLPLGEAGLARIKKGVFGLADAPRQWYLRLHRALSERGWERSPMDFACWFLWSKDRSTLEGIVLSHVDDLLLGGSSIAKAQILDLGRELGFGSIEHDSFSYCGKRITQLADGTIRVSMEEYHKNSAGCSGSCLQTKAGLRADTCRTKAVKGHLGVITVACSTSAPGFWFSVVDITVRKTCGCNIAKSQCLGAEIQTDA